MIAFTTALACWILAAAPDATTKHASTTWAVLSDHIARGDMTAARAYAETVERERALRGQPESPLEAGLLLDVLPTVKAEGRATLLGVAEALSPSDVRIPAAHMLTADLTDALTNALPKAMRIFWRDPVARTELEARIAMALLLALVTTLIVLSFGVALTRARLLAHDLGSWLPPRLRTGGLPLAIVLSLILLPGGLGLGLVGSALLGLTLHSFYLRLSERIVCLLLALGALGTGELVRLASSAVNVSDDASRCLQGGCDPASQLRLHTASRADTDFTRSRIALALLAMREEPPNLAKAEIYLAAAPRGDATRLLGETQLSLHRLRDRCSMYGGKAPPEASEQLGALEKALVAVGAPETLLAAGVTAGLRGQPDLAKTYRERALSADPHRVGRYLAQLPSRRPGREDAEPCEDICAPLFRPQVEVPVFGLPNATVPRAPPTWFRLSGAERPGTVQVLAWMGIVGLLLPLVRRRRVAFACDVCGAPASVRRNPELHGLTECERCLFARIVVATPNRDASGAPREERRYSPLQLASLVLPGLGGILIGRMVTGGLGLLLFLVGLFLQPWSAGSSAVDDGGTYTVAAVLGRVGLVLAFAVWALLLVLELRRPPRPTGPATGATERSP